jgi:16S rRNA (guanine527-N7)-methyltransferase
MDGNLSTSVSRETYDRLAIYAYELAVWQRKINLIGSGTVDDIWSRHIEDCFQVAEIVPDGARVIDIGAGAGLPGLIIAICLAERGSEQSRSSVQLIESSGKKCAFLRAVIAKLNLPEPLAVKVDNRRIEMALPDVAGCDFLTARALAPLSDLLSFRLLLNDSNTISLLQKGSLWREELAEAKKIYNFEYDAIPSKLNPDGVILKIGTVEKR